MRRLSLLLLLLSPAFATNGTEPGGVPVVSPSFLVGQGVSFASAFMDAYSTNRCLAEGRVEMNPFMGSRPSPGRVYGFALGTSALSGFASYEMRKHHRAFWFLPVISNTTGHAAGAIINRGCL